MALHDSPASMLKESLNESLTVAEYCLAYRKKDGGCLGYPAAMILFSIVDTIGSYFRKNKDLKILIDGKLRFIDSDGYKHFFILNSSYFEQHLSEQIIKILYAKFRSLLTHNSVLGAKAMLILGNNHELGAFLKSRVNSDELDVVSLTQFYALCKKAVRRFLNDADEIVPKSKQGAKFQ
jgi:hypothetical protein